MMFCKPNKFTISLKIILSIKLIISCYHSCKDGNALISVEDTVFFRYKNVEICIIPICFPAVEKRKSLL